MHRFALLVVVVGCGDNSATEPLVDSPLVEPRCVPTDVREDFSAFAAALSDTAQAVAAQPGPTKAVGFYVFPRLDALRSSVVVDAACTAPTLLDPACGNDGVCTQLECTRDGWKLHLSTTAAIGDDPVYATTTIDTTWIDGATGVTFEIAAASQSGTYDWSFTGTGEFDVDQFSARLTFPSLLPGDLVFNVLGSSDGAALINSLSIDGAPAEPCD